MPLSPRRRDKGKKRNPGHVPNAARVVLIALSCASALELQADSISFKFKNKMGLKDEILELERIWRLVFGFMQPLIAVVDQNTFGSWSLGLSTLMLCVAPSHYDVLLQTYFNYKRCHERILQ
nr:uncharacterized protein CTRU02_02314 [Colletotrichum truncatum]KAF6798341.1 hypothetical protein CTRU02_02314 [Colletotrichum truncatum]